MAHETLFETVMGVLAQYSLVGRVEGDIVIKNGTERYRIKIDVPVWPATEKRALAADVAFYLKQRVTDPLIEVLPIGETHLFEAVIPERGQALRGYFTRCSMAIFINEHGEIVEAADITGDISFVDCPECLALVAEVKHLRGHVVEIGDVDVSALDRV